MIKGTLMWFIFALASAILAGFRRTGEKRLLTTFDHFTLGYLMQLLSLPIGIGALFAFHQAINPFALGSDFWLLLLFDSLVFYPVNTWLFYKALKQGELSKVMPVQSLGPVVTVLFALVILHEIPSALALAAIVLTVSGLYVLNLKGNKLHNPLKPFMEHKASLYMLGSTLAIALTVPIEKLCIRASNPLTYAVMSTLGASIVLFSAAKIMHRGQTPNLAGHIRSLTLTALFQGAAYITVVYAMSVGPVAYVSAVKSSGILIGALAGVFAFKETMTITKAIAFALIGIGIAALAVA